MSDTIKGPAGREHVAFEAIEWPVEPVLATCGHGDRQLVAPSAIGTPCWRDGKPLRLVTETRPTPGSITGGRR